MGGAEHRRPAAGGGLRPRARPRSSGGGGGAPLRSRRGWMSEGRLRRMRGTAMRQRRPASSTRDDRRRPLPAKHGHAARPQATREYQSDTSSQQRPRSSISPRSGAGSPRPPPVLLDNRSLHISCSDHHYSHRCSGHPAPHMGGCPTAVKPLTEWTWPRSLVLTPNPDPADASFRARSPRRESADGVRTCRSPPERYRPADLRQLGGQGSGHAL